VNEFSYAVAEKDDFLEMSQVRQKRNYCARSAVVDMYLSAVFQRQSETADLPEMQDRDEKTNKFLNLRKGNENERF